MDYKALSRVVDSSLEFKLVKNGKNAVLYGVGDFFTCEYYDKDAKKWVKGLALASSRQPYNIIATGNYCDREAFSALRQCPKAKCIKSWTRGNFDEDPYGRKVKRGGIDCSIWDLRDVFGITEPLENFLPFEVNEFLKGNANWI